MTDSAFIRDDESDWDDGWSRAPHGLWTLDIPNGAKVLLGWLHSHSGQFLTKVTMSHARRAVGSSSIYDWFDALEAAGFVSILRTTKGRAARITLRMAPWKALVGNRNQSDFGLVTAPISDYIEEQEEDHLSSSLRSEDELIAETRVDTRDSRDLPGEIAKEYCDWHVADSGKQPTTKYLALRSIAKALLKAGYERDEIIDAMKLTKVMNAKSVADVAGESKHKREGTASGRAIPASIVRAFAKCEPWFERRGIMQTQEERAYWMRLCATQVSLGYGPGEIMLRMAVALRANNATTFALSDAKVDRFNGEIADYPDAMERAYTNRAWSAK